MATVFLWDTDGLLMTDYLHSGNTTTSQNQHSSYSMSSSRNSDESCHLGVWLFNDNAPAHKSFVARQAVYNCEFVQLNHSAYGLDLTPSNYFLIRNLKHHFRVTDSLIKHMNALINRMINNKKTSGGYFRHISNNGNFCSGWAIAMRWRRRPCRVSFHIVSRFHLVGRN